MSLDDLRARMHALNKTLAGAAVEANEITVALQNYSPTPEPTPVSGVRFGRFVHEVDKTYPINTQTARWSLQVLQGDQWHDQQRAALRSKPGTTTLRYATPVA
jgi:hypothetical protein